MMNSIHRDGEIITRVIRRFGISAVRGSSTRGWMGGLKGMLEPISRAMICRRSLMVLGVLATTPNPECCNWRVLPGHRSFPATYSAAWKTTVGVGTVYWFLSLQPCALCCGIAYPRPARCNERGHRSKRQELEAELMRITTQADNYFARQSVAAGEAVLVGTPQPLPPR